MSGELTGCVQIQLSKRVGDCGSRPGFARVRGRASRRPAGTRLRFSIVVYRFHHGGLRVSACAFLLDWRKQAVAFDSPEFQGAPSELFGESAPRIDFNLWERPPSSIWQQKDLGRVSPCDNQIVSGGWVCNGLHRDVLAGVLLGCLSRTDRLQHALPFEAFNKFGDIGAHKRLVYFVLFLNFLYDARFVMASLEEVDNLGSHRI